MKYFEIICLIDNPNDKTIKYSILSKTLSQMNNDKSYKYDNLICGKNKIDFYYEEIIDNIKNLKNNYLYILFGKSFDHTYSFYDLINNIIDNFTIQTHPFTVNGMVIDICSVHDMVSNQSFDFSQELDDNFKCNDISLDPMDINIFDKIDIIMNKIKTNIDNQKKSPSHYIFTLANQNQRVTIINLNDLLNVSDDYMSSFNKNKYFINSELTNLNIYLLDLKTRIPNSKNNSYLIQLIKKIINDNSNSKTIVKTLFSYTPNEKLLKLSELFYDYFTEKNKKALPYDETIILSKYKPEDKQSDSEESPKMIDNIIDEHYKSTSDINRVPSDEPCKKVQTFPQANSDKKSKIFLSDEPDSPSDTHTPLRDYEKDDKTSPIKNLKIKENPKSMFLKIFPDLKSKIGQEKDPSDIINYSSNNQIIPRTNIFSNLINKDNKFGNGNKLRNKLGTNLIKKNIKNESNEKNFNKPFELIKYSPYKIDNEMLYEKTCIFNKFLFEKCVKNQLKLQEAHKNKDLIESNTKEVLIQMKAMMSVLIEQINEMDL